jgi:hypothetical protein
VSAGRLAFVFATAESNVVSSRETLIEFVRKLPEEMPLVEIARKIELYAGIQTARQQALRREGIAAEDARRHLEEWSVGHGEHSPIGKQLARLPSRSAQGQQAIKTNL